ncbi:MAG: translation elongation factor 4 [Candidatus Paceibacterota bacterium]
MLYALTNADSTPTDADNKKLDNASSQLLYEDLTYKIRGVLFGVKKKIGLGHKEVIYQKAIEEELTKENIPFEKEKIINIELDNKSLGVYRPDFVIDNKIILEIKSLPFIGDVEKRQVWTYLKGSEYKLALLVNFNSRDIDIKRVVYDTAREIQRESAFSQRKSAQVEQYVLNLIDTPGHPDFGYEVSRALEAVEGAILLVDGMQGIQAQTLSNFYAAKKAGLTIIGAVNKVDLNIPDIDKVVMETAELIGCGPEQIHKISGRTGEGVQQLLGAVILRILPPKAVIPNFQFPISNFGRALIFDSFYDDHKGIIASVRVFNGEFNQFDDVVLVAAKEKFKTKEVGYFSPTLNPSKRILEGEIGYLVTGIRDPYKIKIGDTVIGHKSQVAHHESYALPGYKEPKPVVFVSFYPDNPDEYDDLKKSLERLKLNDSSFAFEPDLNEVLGRGFKGGFLGKLHFEIISQRLEREFGIKTITSFPSVSYKIKTSSKHLAHLKLDEDGFFIAYNPKDIPEEFEKILEPMIKVEIVSSQKILGTVLGLKDAFRWEYIETQQLGEKVIIKTRMPLAELISDFDDQLKSVSGGFASFSYEEDGYQQGDLIRMDILVADEIVPGLSRILPKKDIEYPARKMVVRLKEVLPHQQFTQAIQAKVGGRIIARETIAALRKDVTGYLYGGDRTRKMKLWKKQQRGKKKLLSMAKVTISPENFKKLLSK